MLEPVTKKMTDDSTGKAFAFAFYCELCGKPWQSVPVSRMHPVEERKGRKAESERRREHDAAYERANLEAISHFNRCPVCRRWVCDECFRILPERDVCKDCAAGEEGYAVE